MESNGHRTQKAVVLAAGAGTRLQPFFAGPKPLLPVGGTPVVIRTLETLEASGVTQVAVVVGHQAQRVADAVDRWAATRPVSVTCIHNDRWREANGLSVKTAEAFTGDDEFVLCMCDHLLGPGLVDVLQRSAGGRTSLAIDEKIDCVLDFDDATKVRRDGDHRIVAIGKALDPCDAIDCGVFICTAEVHGALERAFEKGEHSLSAGMQQLADRGRLLGVPIGDHFWQDIDTPAMYFAAERLAARLDLRSA